MLCIAYSENDPVSKHAAEFLKMEHGFEEKNGAYVLDSIELLKVEGSLITADFLDSKNYRSILFMSRHHSSAGITSFTAHSLGNWTEEASLGGLPKKLSKSSPLLMLACISNLNSIATPETNKVYEATHHGPFLETPCTFIEFGGSTEVLAERSSAETLGRAAMASASAMTDDAQGCSRVAIGLGGNHYPLKFTKLSLEKGYAFGHIMPSYSFIKHGNTWNTDMIEDAIARSDQEAEIAVIEWKSMGSELRTAVISKLDELGMDYERA